MRRKANNNSENRGGKQVSKIVQISKTLSWFLRHGAKNEGYEMDSAGFVQGEDLLSHPKFKNISKAQIDDVVENNDKKRFELVEEGDTWKIRAVQGHSIKVISLVHQGNKSRGVA